MGNWFVSTLHRVGLNPVLRSTTAPNAAKALLGCFHTNLVQKQMAQGWRVVSCYEAGPFGYGLHRQLTVLGVNNYVIRPRNWDDQLKMNFRSGGALVMRLEPMSVGS